jgi:hypothetical protein
MPRQGTSSRLRDDPGSPPRLDESVDEAPPEFDADGTPSAAAAEALEAAFPEGENFPPLKTPKPKRSWGVLQLILLAILGLAAGFTAVMLI